MKWLSHHGIVLEWDYQAFSLDPAHNYFNELLALHFVGIIACKPRLMNIGEDIQKSHNKQKIEGLGEMVLFVSLWRNKYKYQEHPHRILHLNNIFSSISRHMEGQMLEKPLP